jgi:hypothetical protein
VSPAPSPCSSLRPARRLRGTTSSLTPAARGVAPTSSHTAPVRAGPPRGWTGRARLLSFAADPAGAGLSLAPLVDFARRRVPR